MTQPSPPSPGPPAAERPPPARPAVHLEVRVGQARPALYEVGEAGFLVGSVPGCDLRLPGASLPPVLCLISRREGGAFLRKLAPVQAVAVNGRPAGSAPLLTGDRISLGTAELVVTVTPGEAPNVPGPAPRELEERLRRVEAREQEL